MSTLHYKHIKTYFTYFFIYFQNLYKQVSRQSRCSEAADFHTRHCSAADMRLTKIVACARTYALIPYATNVRLPSKAGTGTASNDVCPLESIFEIKCATPCRAAEV